MELYFIRHGETDYNDQKRYTGAADIPLNAKGIQQVLHLKEQLTDLKPDFAYCSDLKRTVQTMELLDFQIPIRYTPQLREINYGIAEGMTYAEFKEKHPGMSMGWNEHWETFRFPGGESYLEMSGRVTAFIDKQVFCEKGQTGVIVTHGGCICAVLSYYLTGDFHHFWRFKASNGSAVHLSHHNNYMHLVL